MRPKIDAPDALSEAVQEFGREHGMRQPRAWAELVKLGLAHKHEYTKSPPEPQDGEGVRTNNGWESH